MLRSNHIATHSRLFSRFPIVGSSDLEEVRDQVAIVFCDHRLQIIGKSQHLKTEMYFRPGPHIGYGRMSYGAAVHIEPEQLQNFFLLQIPLYGQETIVAGGKTVLSNPKMASIVSPSMAFHMRHEKNTGKLFARIDRQAFEHEFVQYSRSPLRGPLEFAPDISLTTPEGQALLRLITWLAHEASEGVLLDHHLIRAQLESTLLMALLGALTHNQQPSRHSHAMIAPRFINCAEDFMEHNAHEPLTASAIAHHAGISTRSLFAGFRKYRDTTPMLRLKELRLQKAHEQLNAPHQGATVTSIALQWGFAHLGQFAAAYRCRYGELPSKTLLRAQSAVTSYQKLR